MKIKSNLLLDQLAEVTESHIRKAISDFQNMNDEQLLQPAVDGAGALPNALTTSMDTETSIFP